MQLRPITVRGAFVVRALQSTFSVFRTVWTDPSNRGARLQRVGAAIAWQAYKRSLPFPLVLPLDNGLLFCADPSSGNSTAAIYTRIYESTYIQFLRRECVAGGTIIDIGAHVGIYTLLLADLFEGGLCLEPAPDTYALLERNLALNELHRFRARRLAASSASGTAILGADEPLSGGARIIADGVASLRQIPIATTTIDEIATSLERVTFVKIDTEGHEAEVLAGATETLRRSVDALVLFENHPDVRSECMDCLERLGYRCFALGSDGVPTQSETAFSASGNVLAAGPSHPLWQRLRAR
jgi:FkbM family methyltransferase